MVWHNSFESKLILDCLGEFIDWSSLMKVNILFTLINNISNELLLMFNF